MYIQHPYCDIYMRYELSVPRKIASREENRCCQQMNDQHNEERKNRRKYWKLKINIWKRSDKPSAIISLSFSFFILAWRQIKLFQVNYLTTWRRNLFKYLQIKSVQAKEKTKHIKCECGKFEWRRMVESHCAGMIRTNQITFALVFTVHDWNKFLF